MFSLDAVSKIGKRLRTIRDRLESHLWLLQILKQHIVHSEGNITWYRGKQKISRDGHRSNVSFPSFTYVKRSVVRNQGMVSQTADIIERLCITSGREQPHEKSGTYHGWRTLSRTC